MSNLGKLFEESRVSQGYSIEDVSVELRINKEIVRQLEDGGFYELPSYVYAYGFVKKYAEFLKIDFDEIKALFDQECVKEQFSTFTDTVLPPVEHKPAGKKVPINKIAAAILVCIVIAGAAAYMKYAGEQSEQIVQRQEQPVQPIEVTSDNVTDKDKAAVKDKDTDVDKPITTEKVEEKPKKTVEKKKAVTVAEVAKSIKDEKKVGVARNKAMIVFTDTCWVHVNIDNATHLDFIADAGMNKSIAFNDYFIMDIGNASVVSVIHNKKRTSGFGGFRQPVKNLKFSLSDNGTLVYSKIK